MNNLTITPIRGRGVLVFIPRPTPPEAAGGEEGEALPPSATESGWPAQIEGIHTDGTPAWYKLHNDAAGAKPACYQRYYEPIPPETPPTKGNMDGIYLWMPMENQKEGTCQFDPIPYD